MEIPRPARTCSVSQRSFLPNEPFFSVLTQENGVYDRKDVAAEHWTDPPEGVFGWWKSAARHIAENTSQQVSGETLQSLFERLADQPGESDTLYVLTLLLLRKKLLRYEKEITDEHGNKFLEVYALHTNTSYRVLAAMPNHERLEAIQQKLATLTNA